MAFLSKAFADGLRRVVAAPAVLAGVFVMTFLLALPLALTLRGLLEGHLGSSLASVEVADAVNYDWWQEFTAQATGLGTTFTPSVIGFAAVLDNLSGIFDAQGEIVSIAAALATYLFGWLFLSGGILDRYARQRPTRAHAFFSACGVYFFRFLRLGIVAGLAYWFLFTSVHDWLFADLFADVNRDLASEKTAMTWRFGLYAAFGLIVLAVNIVIDYAKIRTVVEDRRSMIGALRAAVGFIWRNPARVILLYAADVLLFLVVIALWALLAPGAGGAGVSMWLAFAGGQLYLIARLIVKLQFMASQTALFQLSLAHAAYVAAPAPTWPESPAVEAISARP
jgi:hypothetical protein